MRQLLKLHISLAFLKQVPLIGRLKNGLASPHVNSEQKASCNKIKTQGDAFMEGFLWNIAKHCG